MDENGMSRLEEFVACLVIGVVLAGMAIASGLFFGLGLRLAGVAS